MHNISFPNLGLDFTINPVAFSIGSLQVYWYGIITALAFLVIILGILRNSEKYGIKQDDLVDLILITTIIGIICARIFYVLVNWNNYRYNLSDIFKIWNGGLAIYGGIIGGLITIYLFCRKRKISTLQVLDHLVVYFALGQAIGRWGNFVNQELFGPNTNLPWAMTGDVIQNTIASSPDKFPGVSPSLPVHPLFLYESLWDFTAFVILALFRKRKKMDGEVFSLYMISYGLARFTIDSMRFDLKVGDFNINRIIGLIFAIVFVMFFVVRRARKKENIVAEDTDEDAGEDTKPSVYRDVLQEIQDESTPITAAEGETANQTSMLVAENETVNPTTPFTIEDAPVNGIGIEEENAGNDETEDDENLGKPVDNESSTEMTISEEIEASEVSTEEEAEK